MIKFGTDGWRAVIAADFNKDNASVALQAIADFWQDSPDHKTVAIGYDTRFLAKDYAHLAACIMAANGIKVQLSETFVSTPNVSHQIFDQKLAGGIMISASHNPPQYNGIKVKAAYAGSASPEITSRIEAKLDKNLPQIMDFNEAVSEGLIELRDFRTAYIDRVKAYVDFNKLAALPLRVVLDTMGGAGLGYLETIFRGTKLQIIPLREKPDPLFYGVNPEPQAENLTALARALKETGAELGLAFDGDADRIGAMDDQGEYVWSHQIFALLLQHLYERRCLQGRVIKTVSVSAIIEKMTQNYGLPLTETPVGFKYICAEMLKGGVLIGGEESGGIGVTGHIPERDALLNALLLLEALAMSGKKVRELWAGLTKTYGPHYYQRVDKTFSPEAFQRLKRRLYSFSESEEMEIADHHIQSINRLDGYKFLFSGQKGWLMARLSGTEPVLRLYCEAASPEEVERILTASQKRFFRI